MIRDGSLMRFQKANNAIWDIAYFHSYAIQNTVQIQWKTPKYAIPYRPHKTTVPDHDEREK